MHPLDSEHFAELRILPFSFGLGALLCLLAAALHRRSVTTLVLAGGLVSGLVSMAIMFYELYNYGHNLDPRAAIDVPPFMPPPLGFNKIANFHVTSFFHLGSIFFIVAIVALVIALWISRPQVAGRKPEVRGSQIHVAR
jgi:copper chaperone NosL